MRQKHMLLDKPPSETCDEGEVVSPWRHKRAGFKRAGVVRRVKDRMNKRFRRKTRQELREELVTYFQHRMRRKNT